MSWRLCEMGGLEHAHKSQNLICWDEKRKMDLSSAHYFCDICKQHDIWQKPRSAQLLQQNQKFFQKAKTLAKTHAKFLPQVLKPQMPLVLKARLNKMQDWL